mgnify:CR=1 FL=1
MSELIRREDCEHEVSRMRQLIVTLATHYHTPTSSAQMLAEDLIRYFSERLDAVPTVTTDEVIAYKCPECRVVSILYDPENEHWCPNCGAKMDGVCGIMDENFNFVSNFSCIHRNVIESNAEYTIIWCDLYKKEISQHGYDCEKCPNSPGNIEKRK